MNENPATEGNAPAADTATAEDEKQETPGSFLRFVLLVALAALCFRSFAFTMFSIPSESMLPRLMVGDYLAASKWPYGYSKHSMPWDIPVIPGRIFADEPERGDIVIFKHPIDNTDYIKRVIGLPGDTVEMREGVLFLNGNAVEKVKIEDFIQPVDQHMLDAQERRRQEGFLAESPCRRLVFEETNTEGERQCRYPQFSETLPNGVKYNVLDLGPNPKDTYGPRIVPADTLFLLGDNRDNSQDSRFPAVAGGGLHFVPQNKLVGRASAMMWSTDGSAEWIKPWTWFSAARWERMGEGI